MKKILFIMSALLIAVAPMITFAQTQVGAATWSEDDCGSWFAGSIYNFTGGEGTFYFEYPYNVAGTSFNANLGAVSFTGTGDWYSVSGNAADSLAWIGLCAVGARQSPINLFDSLPDVPPPPPSPSAGAFISVPTGTASTYTATVGSQFSDAGTLEIMALAVGVPLFFYIVEQMIGILPGSSRRKQKNNK